MHTDNESCRVNKYYYILEVDIETMYVLDLSVSAFEPKNQKDMVNSVIEGKFCLYR